MKFNLIHRVEASENKTNHKDDCVYYECVNNS